MIEYGPLTDEERKEQARNIQEVLGYFDPNISALDGMDEPNLYAARIAARYEATLQEKDKKIAALVTACEDGVKAIVKNRHRGWGLNLENGYMAKMLQRLGPKRFDPTGVVQAVLQMKAAIKEATG